MLTLVTGHAGFIGFHVARALLARGEAVVGIDALVPYYDVALKQARLAELDRWAAETGTPHRSIQGDLTDEGVVAACFSHGPFERVIHLAAQPGIGFSLKAPRATIAANVAAFTNILEACRQGRVGHLVYASTSSVYGANTALPYGEDDDADHPLQLYAASKRANELMAHAYSHLFGLPSSALRFFTVYGPWGRPDMALYKFAEAIVAGEPIALMDSGAHRRDFTYVDDVVAALLAVADRPPAPDAGWKSGRPDASGSAAPWRVLNVGGGHPASVTELVDLLETALGRKAIRQMMARRADDMQDTQADPARLAALTGSTPQVTLAEGVKRFADWFLAYRAAGLGAGDPIG